jgi:hypothetical protein
MTKISYRGPGFLSLLTLLFIALKLLGVITWSWWMVTLPIWILPAIAIGMFLAIMLVVITALILTLGIGLVIILIAAIFGMVK